MELMGLTQQDALQHISKSLEYFKKECKEKQQRIGQAWYNSLSHGDQELLRGSHWDPFFQDNWEAVLIALVYILHPPTNNSRDQNVSSEVRSG